MERPDELYRRIGELEERLARLTEASLSINESLEFETVLQKVLDSALSLTGARYGVIATMDEQGGLETVLTSGTSEDEHRQLVTLPGGTRCRHRAPRLTRARSADERHRVSVPDLSGRWPARLQAVPV